MLTFLKNFGPALLSGVLLAWAFPTFHVYYLAWVALIPLVWHTAKRASIPHAALHFFIAGWLFHSILLQWLATNIYWAGGWALIAWQLMVVTLSIFWAGLGAIWVWGARRTPALGGILFACLWVTMEWLHSVLFTGFGWSTIAHSQGPDLMLLQLASVGGAALVVFFPVFVNSTVGMALARRDFRWPHLGLAAAALAVSHLLGAALLDDAEYTDPPKKVGVFQSNFTNEMKWDSSYTLDMVLRAAKQSADLEDYRPVDLMVWPEALVMADFSYPEILEPLSDYARENDTYLFSGSVRTDQRSSFNSSVLIDNQGEIVDHYDKVHLVPFGEYTPFKEYLPFIDQIVNSNASHGDEQKVLDAGGIRIGPLICFEVLHPYLSENLLDDGAELLAVVTNLAWFGSSNAIPQELEVSRLRAVEARLPLVHSANTGISGMFDPYGRFQPANMTVSSGGRIAEWTSIENPNVTMRRRMVGAFDLPAPASRPIPMGPRLMPMIFAGLAVLLALLAIAGPRRAQSAPPPPADAPPPPETGESPPFPQPRDDISI